MLDEGILFFALFRYKKSYFENIWLKMEMRSNQLAKPWQMIFVFEACRICLVKLQTAFPCWSKGSAYDYATHTFMLLVIVSLIQNKFARYNAIGLFQIVKKYIPTLL